MSLSSKKAKQLRRKEQREAALTTAVATVLTACTQLLHSQRLYQRLRGGWVAEDNILAYARCFSKDGRLINRALEHLAETGVLARGIQDGQIAYRRNTPLEQLAQQAG